MAKNKFPTTDAGATEPREMSPEQHKHFQDLAGHLLTNAAAVGHGHMVGRQGPRGHDMPKNDAAKQPGSYIPQAVFNTTSDGAGSANANDASAGDYGTADPGDK